LGGTKVRPLAPSQAILGTSAVLTGFPPRTNPEVMNLDPYQNTRRFKSKTTKDVNTKRLADFAFVGTGTALQYLNSIVAKDDQFLGIFCEA
jgi:hypothetical protein